MYAEGYFFPGHTVYHCVPSFFLLICTVVRTVVHCLQTKRRANIVDRVQNSVNRTAVALFH